MRMMEKRELKVMRRIIGKTLMDTRGKCKVKITDEWGLKRKREWNESLSRMDGGRLVRVTKVRSPIRKEKQS